MFRVQCSDSVGGAFAVGDAGLGLLIAAKGFAEVEAGLGGFVCDGIDVAGEAEVVAGGELDAPVDLLREERCLRQGEVEFAFGGLQGGERSSEGEFYLGFSAVGGGIIERNLEAIGLTERGAHGLALTWHWSSLAASGSWRTSFTG